MPASAHTAGRGWGGGRGGAVEGEKVRRQTCNGLLTSKGVIVWILPAVWRQVERYEYLSTEYLPSSLSSMPLGEESK